MPKAVFIADFDNTLAHHDGHSTIVYESDLEAIRRFRENGNIFAISTGRGYSVIQPEVRRHGIPLDYLCCNSGAIIIDQDHKIVAEHSFDKETAKALDQEYKNSDCLWYGGCDRDYIMYGKLVGKGFPEEENICPLKSFDEFLDQKKVTGFFSIFSSGEQRDAFKAQVESRNLACNVMLSGPISIDISAEGVSKALSVEELHERYSDSIIYVMGDAMADAGMFVDPAISIAISSGDPRLIELADHTMDSVGEALTAIEEGRI